MFRLVVLPCFDLCGSNSFHVHPRIGMTSPIVSLNLKHDRPATWLVANSGNYKYNYASNNIQNYQFLKA